MAYQTLTGASGSFNNSDGNLVTYTVTATGGALDASGYNSASGDSYSYLLGNIADGAEDYLFSFSQPVNGFQLEVTY